MGEAYECVVTLISVQLLFGDPPKAHAMSEQPDFDLLLVAVIGDDQTADDYAYGTNAHNP